MSGKASTPRRSDGLGLVGLAVEDLDGRRELVETGVAGMELEPAFDESSSFGTLVPPGRQPGRRPQDIGIVGGQLERTRHVLVIRATVRTFARSSSESGKPVPTWGWP